MWRAKHLEGRTLGFVAQALGISLAGDAVRTKGKVGELIERALGADAGSAALHDFPQLKVELKTIPIDARRHPHESTFVCAISLEEADYASWEGSWVRAKLSNVLWVPIHDPPASGGMAERTIGAPLLWRPTKEQEAILRADFDDLMGRIGMGGIEGISAREGRWLQIRPKAASGSVRTTAFGPDGEKISTVPRGFYLRARFTGSILADPTAIE